MISGNVSVMVSLSYCSSKFFNESLMSLLSSVTVEPGLQPFTSMKFGTLSRSVGPYPRYLVPSFDSSFTVSCRISVLIRDPLSNASNFSFFPCNILICYKWSSSCYFLSLASSLNCLNFSMASSRDLASMQSE